MDASADAPETEASNSETPGHAATSAAADDETYAGGVDFRERPSPAVRRELAYAEDLAAELPAEDLAAELPAATDTDDNTDGM